MKKKLLIIPVLACVVLFSSCGINQSLILNHNSNTTQVQLSNNNFKVIDKVTASAEVKYICLVGGMKKKQLYENVYSAMMDKANLMNGSRAIINLVTEEHIGGVPPFYYKRTVTVSAHVIEFTK